MALFLRILVHGLDPISIMNLWLPCGASQRGFVKNSEASLLSSLQTKPKAEAAHGLYVGPQPHKPKDPNYAFWIPPVLGLRTRMWHPYMFVVSGAPNKEPRSPCAWRRLGGFGCWDLGWLGGPSARTTMALIPKWLSPLASSFWVGYHAGHCNESQRPSVYDHPGLDGI